MVTMSKNETKAWKNSIKSMDTEEWIDLLFYRPVGYRWALLFSRLGVHPNTVTVISIFLGVAAAVLFYFDSVWLNMAGMCLLVWANMYDSADGQLARMTGQKSELGRILDGTSGILWFACIYAAIALRLTPEWGIWIWVVALINGFIHSKEAAMADYYRNIHLFFLKGRAGSELADAKREQERFKSMRWENGIVRKVFQWFYANYTDSQEQWSPAFQKLFAALRARYGEDIPAEIRERFRKGSLPLMKYTNILSFNTRAFALFVSLLIGMPWVYFAFELSVLTALFIYMVARHEALCRSILRSL